jgi:hypothetical protein
MQLSPTSIIVVITYLAVVKNLNSWFKLLKSYVYEF